MKSLRIRSLVAVTLALFASLLVGAESAGPAAPTAQPVRIALAGDSTVSDYPAAHANRGWGQFLQERFKDGTVVVTNFAKPGRSTKTFISEGIWAKTIAAKPDYILIQFGHNDSHSAEKPESTDAATDYKENLRRFITEARAIGATPVLVTPMVRRSFDADGKIADSPTNPKSLASYTKAMLEVGAEKRVTVIDLHKSSQELAEKIGPDISNKFANKKGDITHFNEAGARAMADLVVHDLLFEYPKLAARKKP